MNKPVLIGLIQISESHYARNSSSLNMVITSFNSYLGVMDEKFKNKIYYFIVKKIVTNDNIINKIMYNKIMYNGYSLNFTDYGVPLVIFCKLIHVHNDTYNIDYEYIKKVIKENKDLFSNYNLIKIDNLTKRTITINNQNVTYNSIHIIINIKGVLNDL